MAKCHKQPPYGLNVLDLKIQPMKREILNNYELNDRSQISYLAEFLSQAQNVKLN
jgi:hypothetical protein